MNGQGRVFVVYRRTPDGQRAVEYAASVARSFGELHVLFTANVISPIERVRLMEEVAFWTQAAPSTFGWTHDRTGEFFHVGDPNAFSFGDAIVVDEHLASARRDVSVVAPRFESRLFGRGRGPALVPFGDHEPDHLAAERGMRILQGCGFDELVFYHTTWSAEGQGSTDPVDHMNDGARALLGRLRGLADAASLRHRTVVEMADSVPLGIQRVALENRCRLALVARDPRRYGFTFVDSTLDDNPTPVLVVGALKGES